MRHSAWLRIVVIIAAVMTWTGALRAAEQYSFIALGDTAYAAPDDYPIYQSLIESINSAEPAFSIHVGDTKGRGDCGNEFQLQQRDFFNSFEAPVVYTPGNNEWSDCWKANHGNHDPLVVLDSMRKLFWPEPLSLGRKPMALQRQGDGEAFPAFLENARWQTEEITFVTVNVVGDHNNQFLRQEKLWHEFVDREKANVAWIRAAFETAVKSAHKAIVIAMHSDIFFEKTDLTGGPFKPIVEVIAEGSRAFPGQVLVVHGHEHAYMVDRPIREWDSDASTMFLENVTRMQVFGWPEMRAVRVSVDTGTPWVFGFEPLYPMQSMSAAYTD